MIPYPCPTSWHPCPNEYSCRDTGLSQVELCLWSQLFSILGLIVGIMADPAIFKCVHSSVNFVGAKCQLCGLGQYLVSLFGIYLYHPLESWAPVIRFAADPSAGGYTQVSVWHVWNRVVFGSPKVCRILMDTENYSYMCVCVGYLFWKLHICI